MHVQCAVFSAYVLILSHIFVQLTKLYIYFAHYMPNKFVFVVEEWNRARKVLHFCIWVGTKWGENTACFWKILSNDKTKQNETKLKPQSVVSTSNKSDMFFWDWSIKLVLATAIECPIKMSSHVINTEFQKYSEIVSKLIRRERGEGRWSHRHNGPSNCSPATWSTIMTQ